MLKNRSAEFSDTMFDVTVHPGTNPLQGELLAQPSKNYTTRYLLAAALAEGVSTVENCATSADSEAMQRCLVQLGCDISRRATADGVSLNLQITGVNGKLVNTSGLPVNPGNAGAVLRFLLAVCAVMPEVHFVTDHPQSLGKRPNSDLLDSLAQLGCDSESNDGRLPITLRRANLHGGEVSINGSQSSQFLSGLLFLAPLIGEPVRITVVGGLVSMAPVRQTLEVLQSAGIEIKVCKDFDHFKVNPSSYNRGTYQINGDWPGSAALLAAVAATGGQVTLNGLRDDEQGEKTSAKVLQQMGAEITFLDNNNGITLRSSGALKAVEFDGDLATDAVLALMGAACFAQGRTRFYNVSNLRIKECDRISEPIAELRKLGVKCWEGNELGDSDPDAIIIEGNPDGYEGGITVDGRDDHRVIMLLSIVALRCRKPVTILRAHQVSKSYPDYFAHLASLGVKIDFHERNQ